MPDASTVAIDGGRSFQTIDGFGVSQAFGMADAIRNLDPIAQRQALDLLFDTTSGAGFSILRSIIPSDAGSIQPTDPGGPDAAPRYVWSGDDAQDQGQLWLARQARAYGVDMFYNNAWSAPGYMKTNGSDSNGGSLCGTPGASCDSGDWRQAYADYLVQHATFWSRAGITPYAIGFANEPSLATSYASMLVTAGQAASFLSVFVPAMRASGLSTKVTCGETVGFDLLPAYVSAVATSDVDLFTSHGYDNAPTTPVDTGGKHLWETEWSVNGATFTMSWDSTEEASGITWAQHIHTGLTGAGLNAFLYFWGISTTSHDSSLIGLNGATLTPTKRYYALASYSRFIRPGAVRIAAATADGDLRVSGYRNGDGSVVLVALNLSSDATAATFAMSDTGVTTGTAAPFLTNDTANMAAGPPVPVSGATFTANLPARSLVTFHLTAA